MAEPSPVDPIAGIVMQDALAQGINPALALAVAHQESGGLNPQARNPKGDAYGAGLFGFIPSTAKSVGMDWSQRFDPAVSSRYGTQYLAQLLQASGGDVTTALRRYGGADAPQGDPQYDTHVLAHYPKYAQYEGLRRSPSEGTAPSTGGSLSLDDLVRVGTTPLTQESPQGAAPASGFSLNDLVRVGLGQGGAPADSGMPMDTQVLPNADPSQPALLAPPGAVSGPGTGGYQMTMDIAKPSTGNPPEDLQRVPEAQWDELLGRQQGIGQFAKQGAAMVTSGVGAAGGAFLGGLGGTALAGPVGGVAGAIGGEMAGSFGAHKLNQAIGLEPGKATEFDTTLWPPSGDITSLLVPPLVRGAGALSTQVVKRLPGAPAALHEEAVKSLEGYAKGFAPPRPSAELYAELAAGSNPRIASVNLATQASDILNEQMLKKPSFRNGELIKHAEDLIELFRDHQGQIPLSELYRHQKEVGLLVRQAQRAAAPEEGALKRLYGAFHGDIEGAIAKGVPEAATLREATVAARREFAQEDLAQMFTPGAPGMKTRPDGLTQVHGGTLQDGFNRKLMTDPAFAKAFSPEERTEIQNLFHDIQKIPRIPAPKGVAVGSSLAAARGGLTYGVMKAVTGDPEMARVAASIALAAPPLIAKAVMTAPGRALLRRYINAGQVIGPAELAALRTAATMGLGEEGATAPGPVPVGPALAPQPGLLGPGRVPMPGIQR